MSKNKTIESILVLLIPTIFLDSVLDILYTLSLISYRCNVDHISPNEETGSLEIIMMKSNAIQPLSTGQDK